MNKKYFLILALFLLFKPSFTQESIYEIQYTLNSLDGTYPSLLAGQDVTIGGIVTATNYNDQNYFISSSSGGAWQGIFIYDNNYIPAIGDSIIISGLVYEYYGMTEIKNLTTFNIISSSNALPNPVQVSTNELFTEEAFEGVFCELNNVSVSQIYNEYDEWQVDDGSGSCIIDNGIFDLNNTSFPLIPGYPFYSIKGVVIYSYGAFKLHPRNIDDFQSSSGAYILSCYDILVDTQSEFEYPIVVSFLGTSIVSDYEIILQYNPSVITYTGYGQIGNLSSGGIITDLSTTGEVHLTFAGNFSFSGVEEMIDLKFTPNNSGISTMNFVSGSMNGTPIPYFFDGEINTDIGNEPIGDTLTVIQKPLLNIPEIVVPGENFEIICNAPPSVANWQASLIHKDYSVQLQISESIYYPDLERWYLTAIAPDPEVYELFDLKVSASGITDDITKDAVHVIPQEKENYYFIHITDPHLPTHYFYPNPLAETDTSEIVDLREVINDINLINPEFVLLTGDFINEGELEDFENRRYYSIAQRLLTEFDVPVYLVSGNHDIGGWLETPAPDGSARHNWWRFFGWKWLQNPPPGDPNYTQNYSFDYGNTHYVGLESYINYDGYMTNIYGNNSFIQPQLNWLTNDLLNATPNSSMVLFYHYDFDDQINLSAMDADMALYGHIHSNSGDINQYPYDLATDNVCDGNRAYRLIRVNNGVIQPLNTSNAGSNGENLTIEYTPSNNGTIDSLSAQITNNQDIEFDHAQIKFIMPKGNFNYVVLNGDLMQVDNSGDFAVCYVDVNVPANDMITVKIKADIIPDLLVDITALLEGPFNGMDMSNDLTNNPDLIQRFPINQPYNTAPWNYNGTESVASIPNSDIVDWVLIEFRDSPDATTATELTTVKRQAAFLKKDGSIVGLDGSSILSFSHSIIHSLYVVFCHRNHVDIMSANPLTDLEGIYTYDFTTSIDQAYGGTAGYKSIAPGIFGLAGGDIDANGTINYSDIFQWTLNGGNKGYLSEDLNFDGEVNNLDKDDVWIINNNVISSQVPE